MVSSRARLSSTSHFVPAIDFLRDDPTPPPFPPLLLATAGSALLRRPRAPRDTLPGDFGASSSVSEADPERLKYYVEAEKMNARWAMAAA